MSIVVKKSHFDIWSNISINLGRGYLLGLALAFRSLYHRTVEACHPFSWRSREERTSRHCSRIMPSLSSESNCFLTIRNVEFAMRRALWEDGGPDVSMDSGGRLIRFCISVGFGAGFGFCSLSEGWNGLKNRSPRLVGGRLRLWISIGSLRLILEYGTEEVSHRMFWFSRCWRILIRGCLLLSLAEKWFEVER